MRMLAIFSRTLCFAVLLIAFAASAAETWTPVHSKEGGFTAFFPKAPAIKTEPANASGGVASVYLADLGKTAFEVSYTDYQPGAFAGRMVDRIYNAARNDLVKGQPVKLLADRPVTLEKVRGREVIFAEQDGYTQAYRFFVVKDRLYALVAGGPAGSEKSAETKRFLDSFKLTPAP